MTAAVRIEGLLKRFPGMERPAVNAVSGSLFPGTVTGLVGPDGAGKTTLIRLLVGLLRADEGRAEVCGFDAAVDADKIHAVVGYMPQRFGLYEDLSVAENMRLYADLRGVVEPGREGRFAELLAFTGLEAFRRRLAGKLSGGMKQKLGLACVLLGEPRVLLLDEPSVGVDPVSRRELWRMVRELMQSGIAVLWSTSYLDEAEQCDGVLLLNEGELLYGGPPGELLRRVEGRVYALGGIAEDARRALLMRVLEERRVADAVIEGRSLRVLARSPGVLPPLGEGEGDAGGWKPVAPRFEDAFLDMLGGGPSGTSAIGDAVAVKPDTEKPVIDARGLTKRFGDFTAVRDNSFRIQRGEIFGLLGPNGAGKSTTFKMMCGLLRPTSGTASVMGYDLQRASARARSRIGYMAQKFSLYGTLSVAQNLRFFSGVYGLAGKERERRVAMMTELFGLGPYASADAELLPLGFKQRLALACAVMHQPDVLFLDEPTSGVDPVTRREFWMHINAMVRKGVTVMVTTHFMDEAEYCDRIALIHRGENIAMGTPDALKAQAAGADLPDPSLEDAFIELVERSAATAEEGERA